MLQTYRTWVRRLPVPKHAVDLMHDRYRRVSIDGKFFLSKHSSEPVMLMCFEQMAGFPLIFLKKTQGVGDHESHSIGWKPLGPLFARRIYRYPCFLLHIRTVPVRQIVEASFLQKTCMLEMPFRRIED